MSGTTVRETVNVRIVLDQYGFYAACNHCPWISPNTASKWQATVWATAHDEDRPVPNGGE